MKQIGSFFRFIILGFIRAYQYFISPLLGQNCIYTPSCSAYAVEAIEKHGVFRGFFYAVLRILKCHPFAKGGLDPVPAKKEDQSSIL